MEVTIASLLAGAQKARGTVVIVDVYRAFTTAAVAFSKGAEKIIMTAEVDEALELRDRGAGHLCMGEVAGMRPPGFDLGNSPFEMFQADVGGKTLIQSTRAGTVGVVAAASNADRVYAASLVVAAATAKAVLRLSPDLVSLVAMGVEGGVRSDEDEQCVLYIRNLLQSRRPDPAAVRMLVLAGAESQKFGDPARPHFHSQDMDIALRIDSISLAIRVSLEKGLLVARPESI